MQKESSLNCGSMGTGKNILVAYYIQMLPTIFVGQLKQKETSRCNNPNFHYKFKPKT